MSFIAFSYLHFRTFCPKLSSGLIKNILRMAQQGDFSVWKMPVEYFVKKILAAYLNGT